MEYANSSTYFQRGGTQIFYQRQSVPHLWAHNKQGECSRGAYGVVGARGPIVVQEARNK